ncbi:class Ib ribonucleoside-diphosphate reductase assembly flavoprotein NrdI [Streptobacillus ratti]|uniref:class Ib ribonucleoside-diphosphate reductase assembly flavoprotein NrdI n=1 Tax=Streptobacillus ratti TaxID=1720557 RepID=UPI0009F9402C|nr:class Ib ribonucleoside-diphosphate reductase assembly flavoprotein NrdI [Streptobacillus ratti]
MNKKIIIYYESLTGNVEKFICKIKNYEDFEFIKISSETIVEKEGHLITFTTGFGQISKNTDFFLTNNENYRKIKTVCSSGNMNWGKNFAKAGELISEKYGIHFIFKFELSGTMQDVKEYIRKLKKYEKERESN